MNMVSHTNAQRLGSNILKFSVTSPKLLSLCARRVKASLVAGRISGQEDYGFGLLLQAWMQEQERETDL